MKKQTFDAAAYAAELDRRAAERQKAYDRIKAYEAAIRATAPNRDVSVRISYPSSNSRWSSLTDVTGWRDDVYAYVADQFTEQVTQCYEHMATRLYNFIENADGTVTARLSKNLYAGD